MARSGRKPKSTEWLQPEKLKEIEDWSASGVLEKDIASNIGIKATTWCSWKNKFPEFSEAIKRGIKRRCQEAEKSLDKLVSGYTYTEVRTETIMKGEEITGIKRVETVKQVQPSLGAVIFYLCNANPEKWQNQRIPIQAENTDMQETGGSAVKDWIKATRPSRKAVEDLFSDEESNGSGEEAAESGE